MADGQIQIPSGCSRATRWRHKKGGVVGSHRCPLCDFAAMTLNGMVRHVRAMHGLNGQQLYERYASNPCQACGRLIPYRNESYGMTMRRRFCGIRCNGLAIRGPEHPQYKGGSLDRNGYRVQPVSSFDVLRYPFLLDMIVGRGRRVLEHRANMAIHLGRALGAHETVHHKNGDRADNRIENLELWTGRHGNGARARDIMCPHCGKSYG